MAKSNSRKKKGSDTGKPWKEFERKVSEIEKSLAPLGAVIKSPDHINDLSTDTPREVDASITYKLGSVPITVTIECRDRNSKQDVMWIEQIAAKKMNLGVSSTIAVSSKGFSKEAIVKARQLGIILRKLDKLSPDKIMEHISMILEYRKYECRDLVFEWRDSDLADKYYSELKKLSEEDITDKKILQSDSSENIYTPRQVFASFYNQADKDGKFDDIIIGKNEVSPRLVLNADLSTQGLFLKIGEDKLYLKKMIVGFHIYNMFTKHLPQSATRYIDAAVDESIIEEYEFLNTESAVAVDSFIYTVNRQTGDSEISVKKSL